MKRKHSIPATVLTVCISAAAVNHGWNKNPKPTSEPNEVHQVIRDEISMEAGISNLDQRSTPDSSRIDPADHEQLAPIPDLEQSIIEFLDGDVPFDRLEGANFGALAMTSSNDRVIDFLIENAEAFGLSELAFTFNEYLNTGHVTSLIQKFFPDGEVPVYLLGFDSMPEELYQEYADQVLSNLERDDTFNRERIDLFRALDNLALNNNADPTVLRRIFAFIVNHENNPHAPTVLYALSKNTNCPVDVLAEIYELILAERVVRPESMIRTHEGESLHMREAIIRNIIIHPNTSTVSLQRISETYAGLVDTVNMVQNEITRRSR